MTKIEWENYELKLGCSEIINTNCAVVEDIQGKLIYVNKNKCLFC